jgi:hypothetical protein
MLARYIRAFGGSAVLHLLALGALVVLMRQPPARAAQHGRQVAVVIVPPAEDPVFPGLKPVRQEPENTSIDQVELARPLPIADFTVDARKIAEREAVLFPFVTPGLSIEHFFPVSQGRPHIGLENPFVRADAEKRTRTGRPPLVLGGTALQALVDKSWSRHDRWDVFEPVRRLAEAHSADAGDLPLLLKKYCDENWLQPYADTVVRDPRLWVQLRLAADHVTFIGFIRQYVSAHPSTRATTELLFLLDKIAQASRDTLGVLLDTDPASRLAWTRYKNPQAYRLVNRLRARYAQELSRRGLTTGAALDRHYDAVRLAILNGIVSTTPGGYGADDARFLIGAIHWKAHRPEEALRAWLALTPNSGGSYAAATSGVRLALHAAKLDRPEQGASVDQHLQEEIDRILRNQQGRWLMFSFDRLQHFGYRFDTY